MDGPDIKRQLVLFKNILLMPWIVDITHKADHNVVVSAWKEANIETQWKNCKKYNDIQDSKMV